MLAIIPAKLLIHLFTEIINVLFYFRYFRLRYDINMIYNISIYVPFDATVVIKIPTVARISGDGSPTADRHSCFMKTMTSGRNL